MINKNRFLHYITFSEKGSKMLEFLTNFFQRKQIYLFAPIPLSECEIRKPYLLEREGITDGTVIMLAAPYFTRACLAPDRNVSAYAVSRDYHGFYRELFDELLPLLRKTYPNERFAGFADHSPIAELQAAARAGLGVIGKNGLLITSRYSSYVFLGELVTTAKIPSKTYPIQSCIGCGKCRRACPMEKIGDCLSAMTQKKGDLTDAEKEHLLRYGSVWGCDICQDVCPHTVSAIRAGTIFTPIPYFEQDAIPHLSLQTLDEMSDATFSERAYAWRGRETIRRNLILSETNESVFGKGEPCSN